MADKQNSPRNKTRKTRFYKSKALWLSLLLFFSAAGLFAYVFLDQYTAPYRERAGVYDLEKIDDVERPSIIYDRNREEIGRIFLENRSIISIDNVPQKFIDALVAGEDSRFWSHGGVDYMGIARAGWLNYRGSRQGASTITQQLARGAFSLEAEARKRGETTIQRKIVEIYLAKRIEQRYKKREILGFYLNRIYFGSGFYGIRSAALGYFGKEPVDLTVEECASIVALIKSPNSLSPLNNPESNKKWRNFVLGRMNEEGMLSKAEMQRCQALPLTLNPKPLRRGTTHLYERVFDSVRQALGEEALASGGFKIHTTILKDAQEAAQKALEESLVKAESHPLYKKQKHREYNKRTATKPPEYVQGAVLMMDHETGEVLAHVGGRDYDQSPYDFIELGKRPLGTAFFPFLYAVALSSGQTPATLLEDEWMDNRTVMVGGQEGVLGEWGAEVQEPVYEGKIPLRKSFEFSKVSATVRLGQQIGLQKIVDGGVAFGFPMAKIELLPRICVGWEQVSMKQAIRAFSSFARAGRAGPSSLVYIDRVEDPAGSVVYRRPRSGSSSPLILDEATAFQVHHMMGGSLERGTGAGGLDGLIEKPFHGAGKGGSTHDFADAWFLGYNKRVTCGVWTGFLNGGDAIYPGAFSRDLALPVWQATMNAIAPSFGGGNFPVPSSVVEVPVCSVSGQRATQYCQHLVEDVNTGTPRSVSLKVSEYFRKGTENLPFCSVHSAINSDGISPDISIASLPTLDVSPVRPQSPVLIGDDPYHSEVPTLSPTSGNSGLIRRRTNVLDSLDIGDMEDTIQLRRPGRLQIDED